MAQDIQVCYPTGSSLYAVVLNASAQVWAGSGFETPQAGHWAEYAVALTEASGSGVYSAAFPSGITVAGPYNVLGFLRAGGSAAASDELVWEGGIDWTGSGAVSPIGGYGSGQDPASQLFANGRFRAMAAYVDGKYTYNPSTGIMALYDTDGATALLSISMTFDINGNITLRTASGIG